jgi:glycosyltransferase involved in cell wall biosynthesis/O-antigen/teichoic acid export membrane protein
LIKPKVESVQQEAPIHQQPRRSPVEKFCWDASWLTLSAVLVGVLNYVYSICLTWLLTPHDYSMFAGGQALLLVCGTIASASVPWLISQGIARAPQDLRTRQELISFGSILALVQGLVAAVVAVLAARRFTSSQVAIVLAGNAVAIFCATVSRGYLQGFGRFRLVASLSAAEAVAKIGIGLMLVAAGAGAAGALGGFGGGAFVLIVGGLLCMRHDLTLRAGSIRQPELWRRVAWLTTVQVGLAILANADAVLASASLGSGGDLARFQVSIILGRSPLFLAIALATAIFPALSAPRAPDSSILGTSTSLYVRMAGPLAVVVATTPQAIVDLAFPSDYAGVTALLPLTASSGLLIGAIYLLLSSFQAQQRFRTTAGLLAMCLIVHVGAIVAGLKLGAGAGAAVGGLVGAASAVALVTRKASATWPGALRIRSRPVLACLASLPVALQRDTLIWSILAIGVLAGVAWTMLRGHRTSAATARLRGSGGQPGSKRSLRILHLAYEDHRQPGSGGGSIRTREVNRRLATRHQVTVVTMKYKGSVERVEDGVHYIQVGVNAGHTGRVVSYFAALPLVLRRHPSDLVIEDFAAPISSVAVPLWTRRPVVGMVQWFNAREKSAQYKLPFFLFEKFGVRTHQRLIAVSLDLARELAARNPTASIEVIPNGIEHDALERQRPRSADALFLGRLEVEPKGLDLLLRAFALVADSTSASLLVAGDGRGITTVNRLRDDLGLGDRVRLLGRVEGSKKAELLASAQVLCMPSRYETFGIVAAEALAARTPVLAFDIPCLRELLPPSCSVRVTPFDVEAYAQALLDLLNAPDRCRRLGEAGPQQVRELDWEKVAQRQEHVYLEAVGASEPFGLTTGTEKPRL